MSKWRSRKFGATAKSCFASVLYLNLRFCWPDAVKANGYAVIEQVCLQSLAPIHPAGLVDEPLQSRSQDGRSPAHAAI